MIARDGVPLLADPDFADWFAHAGVATVPIRLDGRPKLMAASYARPDAIARPLRELHDLDVRDIEFIAAGSARLVNT